MNNVSKLIVFCLLPFLLIQHSVAKDKTSPYLSIPEFLVLEDSMNIYSFEEITTSLKDQFHTPLKNAKRLNYGTAQIAAWIKLDLSEYSTEQHVINDQKYLYFSPPLLSEVEVFFGDKAGNFQKIKTGVIHPESTKAEDNKGFAFPIEEGITTCYVRIYTLHGFFVPVEIVNQSYMAKGEKNFLIIQCLFIGLALFIFVYNIFLWFTTKELIYGHYSLFAICSGLTTIALSGFAKQYIFTGTHYDDIVIYTSSISGIISHTFAIHFLRLKKYPIVYKIQWAMILGYASTFVIGFTEFMPMLSTVALMVLLFTAAYVWYRKYSLAKYYLLAIAVFATGFNITIMAYLDVIPTSDFTNNSILFGAAGQMLLFAFAVAAKVNWYKKEVELERQKNLQIISKQKEILEEKVFERTKELQSKTEEISSQNEELFQQQEEMTAQRDYIDAKNKELQSLNTLMNNSVEAANRIQRGILPSEEILKNLIGEFTLLYMPRDIVSGDFYWCAENEDFKIIVVADCTGHGVSGAFMTMIGNTLLDKIVRLNNIYEPAQILDSLDLDVQRVLKQSETDNSDGMDAAIIKIDKKQPSNSNLDITFSGAKSPIYYILPPSEGQDPIVQMIKGSGKTIGGMRPKKHLRSFDTHHLSLPKGTTIYLTTDGYQDQSNNARRGMGRKGLIKIIENAVKKPISEQKDYLEEQLYRHMQASRQRDDILVLGFKL